MEKLKNFFNNEVVRFILVGAICTLIDLIVRLLFNSFLPLTPEWIRLIIPFIIGFIVSLIFNYILSATYVFKGKKKLGDLKAIGLFSVTSTISLISGLAIFYSLAFMFRIFEINIVDFSIFDIIESFTSVSFWCYLVAFVVQTLLTLALNYWFRKKFIFK